MSSDETRAPTDCAQAWLRIEASELKIAGVTAGTGFAKAVGLRISGKIFAFPKDGELILKLPSSRVTELIEIRSRPAVGAGCQGHEGVGRRLGADSQDSAHLVAEARTFVGSA